MQRFVAFVMKVLLFLVSLLIALLAGSLLLSLADLIFHTQQLNFLIIIIIVCCQQRDQHGRQRWDRLDLGQQRGRHREVEQCVFSTRPPRNQVRFVARHVPAQRIGRLEAQISKFRAESDARKGRVPVKATQMPRS